MKKIFIDGKAGTTGLRIYERLSQRTDVELIILSDEMRKDPSARRDALSSADIAFLCLPDAAAKEAVELALGSDVCIIDTSTAHRTEEGWTYGFPEIVGKEKIASSCRIANPGCHASGFIALVYPLVKAGAIKKDKKLSCFSLTGYTGGGKKMIAEYEGTPEAYASPRQYGLMQAHKHLPEMKKVCGLEFSPCFCPIVSNFPCGMEVTVPLFGDDLTVSMSDVKDIYRSFYTGKVVGYSDDSEEGFLASDVMAGKDGMIVSVFGNDERMTLTARFDNLGKGASGAAIQNMNLLLGVDETKGLIL